MAASVDKLTWKGAASVDKLTWKGRFLGVPPVNKELQAPNACWENKLLPERSPLTDYPTESGQS